MFDPYKVKRYIQKSRGQGDPGGVFVAWHDYKQLLERYNLLLVAEPARVVPFQDGYWVFAKEYSFFTKSPENGQKLKYPDKVGFRPPNYKGNWR